MAGTLGTAAGGIIAHSKMFAGIGGKFAR